MDTVYQSIKNFFRSFINLFVAVIELITSLINLLAFAFGKLRPHISDQYAQMRREKRERSALEHAIGKNIRKKERTEEIRRELKEQITDQDTYDQLYAHTEEDGAAVCSMILAVLLSLLTINSVLAAYSRSSEMCMTAILASVLLCAAACLAIYKNQRKTAEKRLIRQILEEEFREKAWEKTKEPFLNNEEPHDKEEINEPAANEPAEKTELSSVLIPEDFEKDFSAVEFNLPPSENVDNPYWNSNSLPR